MLDEIKELLLQKIITSATGINRFSNPSSDKIASEAVLNLIAAYKQIDDGHDAAMMKEEIAMLRNQLDVAYNRITEFESKYEWLEKESET